MRRTLDLGGHPLVVTTTDGPGLPVLLLHGWTATAAINWDPTLARLGGRFAFVAFDQRGHGGGLPRGPEPVSIPRYAADAARVLDALGVRRCVVAGYSMGGAVAQQLARQRRDLVAGLVLAATADHFVAQGAPRTVARGALGAGAGAARRLDSGAKAAVRDWLLAGHRHEPVAAGGVGGHDLAALAEAGEAVVAFDARGWLGDLRVPVAVVATATDTVVPLARQLATARAVRGATLHICPGGHDAALARPDDFAAALAAALVAVGAG